VNHTLSQSVPPAVITTVNGYTKVLLGELIELARDVQLEWQAAAATLPNNEPVSDDTPVCDRIKSENRGPLTPDHLREALRRYKKNRAGGCAGYLGLSLAGREAVAARMGGRRLFR
jgi:transcription initiation factor TFIID subunit 11